MTETVIRVENLGKRYVLGQSRGASPYKTLRESITDMVSQPFRRASTLPLTDDEFWALKDVSFDIKRGEVAGVIGRNGAGKSTLLKVLSRITEPTTGRITIHGRVASLLEVGTGFHPELTGRENIFLNGAILGMHRTEIKAKFDEIVAFAEVEKFLDTPVKRYSSGMYVRLAFAVAAHLEPEILVVDEVLAVGDAEFQKKCLGKMQDVSRGGRTVLLVSHSAQAIIALCTTTLLFENGSLIQAGAPKEVMARYLGMAPQSCYRRKSTRTETEHDVITAAWLERARDPSGQPLATVANGAQIELVVQVTLKAKSSSYVIASFWDDVKRPLWEVVGGDYSLPQNGRSELRIRLTLPKLSLPNFSVDLALGNNHAFEDHVRDAIVCLIESDEEYTGGGQRFPFAVETTCQVAVLPPV